MMNKSFIKISLMFFIAVISLLGFFVVRAQATFHNEWSDWSAYGEWGQCKTEQTCGVAEGVKTRTRKRICVLKLGHGDNECSLGQTQTQSQTQGCIKELPACEEPPCLEGIGVLSENQKYCDPTPTASPSATPTPGEPGNPPTFAGSSTDAPSVPQCNEQIDAPLLQGFERVSPTQVKFSWWQSLQGEHQTMVYGYSENELNYGTTLADNQTEITLNDLEANRMVWAQVWATKGGCVAKSVKLDP